MSIQLIHTRLSWLAREEWKTTANETAREWNGEEQPKKKKKLHCHRHLKLHLIFFSSFSLKSLQKRPLALLHCKVTVRRLQTRDGQSRVPPLKWSHHAAQSIQNALPIRYLSNTLNSHTLIQRTWVPSPNRPITARSHVLSGGQSDQYRTGLHAERSFFSSSRNDLTPAPRRRGGGEKWEVPPLHAPGGGN